MFRKALAQRIGFPLQDFYTNTRIIDTRRFLMESQYWDKERIEEYRLLKLKSLVQHAYINVPFYRKKFDMTGLKPSDINKMEDIKKIPVVTKADLRSENSDFVARGGSKHHIRIGKTGGTTGSPTLVYKDQYDRTFTWASYYRWYTWMGLEMGSKSLTLWGARNVTRVKPFDIIKTNVTNYIQNTVDINSFNINRDNIGQLVRRLNHSKPHLIKGYTSALLFLGEYLEEKKEALSYSPTAISTTTETLFPHNRQFLEKVFNAPVYDQYGCGEVAAIAYECSHHNGLHINQEHVIVEILDDNGMPADQQGNIIVTNLDNYIMPFIRYANGDVAAVSEKECSCGVCQPLMTSLYGRSCETITLKSGARVHGVFFTDILYEKGIYSDKIHRFQVYQTVAGEIEFRIESPYEKDDLTDRLLYESLVKYFNKVLIIRMKRLEEEPNGKFKYIKLG
jgi:phenylacetate-CoA ligase